MSTETVPDRADRAPSLRGCPGRYRSYAAHFAFPPLSLPSSHSLRSARRVHLFFQLHRAAPRCLRTPTHRPAAEKDGDAAYTERDHALRDQMSGYWINFVRTGNPNGPGLPPWPTVRQSPEQSCGSTRTAAPSRPGRVPRP
ncbi:carboxylesterase family protein [Streptomyces parvulus]|uniref:carboxylesterase family protein n=1 Tax=Streptomyces parvulus TaxID=146923 RepID=UPI003317BA59